MVNVKKNWYILFFSVLGLFVSITSLQAAAYQHENPNNVASGEKNKITVKGTVVDENDRPLNDVCISIRHSNMQWFTGKDGKFSFVVDKGAKLTFSCAGKEVRSIRAKSKKAIRVVLAQGVMERMPQFPGESVQQYIARNVKYPKDALELNIEGKVFVEFIIEKDGSISNVRAVRPVFYSLDEEACRVIRAMPRWKPGIQKGKPVRVSYTVPINFGLR